MTNNQKLKDYCPESLLPICGKIFLFLYKSTFSHYSWNVQVIWLEIRGVFLDILKAFDKVWHEDLIFKLKQNGVSGNLLNLLCDFWRNRKQKVLLNGQISDWSDVNAGVLQGSILGPLLFLIYINSLSEGLSLKAKQLVNDTFLFSMIHDSNTSALELNSDLAKINRWAF